MRRITRLSYFPLVINIYTSIVYSGLPINNCMFSCVAIMVNPCGQSEKLTLKIRMGINIIDTATS